MKGAILKFGKVAWYGLNKAQAALKWFEPIGIAIAIVGLWIAYEQFTIEAENREKDRALREATLYVMAVERLSDARARGKNANVGQVQVMEKMAAIGASMASIDASNVNLIEAGFRNADLWNADLKGADLSEANLTVADLTYADVTGASLRGAYLIHADLTGATLTNVTLTNANLSGANLEGANLTGADLSQAFLGDADLSDADLMGANLTNADLKGASFWGARLFDADLTGASLGKANFTLADFTGANLTNARLSGANFERAWYREGAEPKGIDPGLLEKCPAEAPDYGC